MEAGWYGDGHDARVQRWWDGTAWTSLTRPVERVVEPAAPPAPQTPPPPPVPPAPPLFASTDVPTTVTSASPFHTAPQTPAAAPLPPPPVPPPPAGAGHPGPPSPVAAPVARTSKGSVVALVGAAATVLVVAIVAAALLVGRDGDSQDVQAAAVQSATTVQAPTTTMAPATTAPPTTVAPTAEVAEATPPTTSVSTATPVAPPPSPIRTVDGPTVDVSPTNWRASSTLDPVKLACEPGRTMSYGVERAFDNDPDTAWAAARGRNAGEWIEAYFEPGTEIREISLYNGYLRQAARKAIGCQVASSYEFNRQITQIEVVFADGDSERFRLLSTEQLQQVVLAEPRITSSIRIRILDTILPRGADNDTLITDIYFGGAR